MTVKTIIGLEIHVELLTDTKMFCGCKNAFGDAPNTNVCEVCLGLPGALPKPNKKAIEFAMAAGLAMDCSIRTEYKMDRKKYFYPDLVKGYQITQADMPLCTDGFIEIETESGKKNVRIERIHIEEDTGKAIHNEKGDTLMDYNRSGVPLIEIVSRPDMETAEEARAFLQALKARLEYLGISDVKMEEGSLRCDVNINVKDTETDERTKITEVKNLNSFKAVGRAIETETVRHTEMLQTGELGRKETRRWDDNAGKTIRMRTKEEGNDYRYSVEGDIPFVRIPESMRQAVEDGMPEMPHVKKERFMKEYGIKAYDAENLTASKALAGVYEELMQYTDNGEIAANWMLGDVSRHVNAMELDVTKLPFTMQQLADLLSLLKEGTIHQNGAKKVLKAMFEKGGEPKALVDEMGLSQITDTSALDAIVDEVLAANPESIEDIKNGKDRAIGFLVGQCMKQSKGKGNPKTMRTLIEEKIQNM